VILLADGDLNEAELFEVAMQTVRLRIDRDAIDLVKVREYFR
jgi:hypothetical protein